MRIEVIKVETESKGKYSQCTVTYRAPDGKVEAKKLVSFGPASPVFKVLKDASVNDVFEVKSEKILNEKDQKEYWYWTEAVVTGKVEMGKGSSNGGATVSPRSTYETPEERARKQLYIVRQSSIAQAIQLLSLQEDKEADVDSVLDYARQFEAFVFQGESASAAKGFELPDIEIK